MGRDTAAHKRIAKSEAMQIGQSVIQSERDTKSQSQATNGHRIRTHRSSSTNATASGIGASGGTTQAGASREMNLDIESLYNEARECLPELKALAEELSTAQEEKDEQLLAVLQMLEECLKVAEKDGKQTLNASSLQNACETARRILKSRRSRRGKNHE